MAVYKKVPGHETVNISTLEFDTTPKPGSLNPVTSGGVAEAVGKNEQDMKDMEEMFLVNLPCAAKTLRFEFSKMDYDPTVAGVGSSGTWKKVNAKFHNVWDWTNTNNVWTNAFSSAFSSEDNLVKVIAAGDTSAVTHFVSTFAGCTSLVELCLFDMAGTKEIASFVRNCSKLRKIPPFKTIQVIATYQAFYGCVAVETGALDMYTTLSTQSTPPTTVSGCFTNCGRDTTTGAAELAQIPASWGGTASG